MTKLGFIGEKFGSREEIGETPPTSLTGKASAEIPDSKEKLIHINYKRCYGIFKARSSEVKISDSTPGNPIPASRQGRHPEL
jgi:hypothetical protein